MKVEVPRGKEGGVVLKDTVACGLCGRVGGWVWFGGWLGGDGDGDGVEVEVEVEIEIEIGIEQSVVEVGVEVKMERSGRKERGDKGVKDVSFGLG